ncbi:MAG: tetratricopeptide repeat protein [Desulfomicrobium sp.]|nr:tetratricopeptide repeat protein [Pseudomonadota bacterium]MBV1710451.1 tetratricopeptide repeat protein [Desulfomicrobium sp.]MBU4570072.1 tetratricopeptide repeat protein [Pseudomonadota bacterium]MBU4593990.1 tetratricopeptide repeat protein [Pseudomonadota bacterium]MBV1721123.1 tetratricopeptide repeat protein [Desulfomicrobium sp.]
MRRIFCILLVGLMLGACASKDERKAELFQNGLKLEQAGRIAEARVEAKNIIKIDPNHAGAYLLLARCALTDQNWREAYAGFQRAAELEPENIEALLGVGRIYLLSGDTSKAEELSGQVLRIDPDSRDGKLLRAGAMLRAKRFGEAEAQLEVVFAHDPHNEDALIALSVIYAETGRLEEALDVVRRGIEARPDSRVLHFRAANLAADSGDMPGAERHLLRLKELDPENRGVMVLLASLYERMGDAARVEGILTGMLEADPASEEARLRLVEYLARHGKIEEAQALVAQTPKGPTPKLRLALAAVHAAAGDMPGAETVLAELAADKDAGPTGIEARLRVSEIKLRRGDRDGALAEVDEVLRVNPTDARAHAARGRIFMLQDRFEEALAELRIALHDSPDDMAVVVLMARAQFALGNTLSGVEALRSFLLKKPDALPVRLELAAHHQRAGEPSAALGVLQGGAVHGQMPAQLHLAMGDIEAGQGNFQAAEAHYRLAALEPEALTAALMRLGGMQGSRKEWDAARLVFEELLQSDPDAHGGAEGVVAVKLAAGQGEAALAWAGQRATSRPADPLAADLQGRTALRLGDVDEAEKAFREAQRRAPEWSVPSARLAGLYASTGRKDTAVAECRAALAKNPDSVPEAVLLGQLLQLGGESAEAEAIYRRLLTRHPDLLPAANNLAYLLATAQAPTAEQLTEALALATRASAGGDPSALDTVGWVHYRLGDKDAALEFLRKAHESLPEDPTVTYHLARVLVDVGQTEEARGLLTALLARTQDFQDLAQARELLAGI